MSTSLINKRRFIPSTLSNLSVWLDGADPSTIVQQGGYVTQWNDKSQNENNFVTGTFPIPSIVLEYNYPPPKSITINASSPGLSLPYITSAISACEVTVDVNGAGGGGGAGYSDAGVGGYASCTLYNVPPNTPIQYSVGRAGNDGFSGNPAGGGEESSVTIGSLTIVAGGGGGGGGDTRTNQQGGDGGGEFGGAGGPGGDAIGFDGTPRRGYPGSGGANGTVPGGVTVGIGGGSSQGINGSVLITITYPPIPPTSYTIPSFGGKSSTVSVVVKGAAGGGGAGYSDAGKGGSASYTFSNVPPNTTIQYRVGARGNDGFSGDPAGGGEESSVTIGSLKISGGGGGGGGGDTRTNLPGGNGTGQFGGAGGPGGTAIGYLNTPRRGYPGTGGANGTAPGIVVVTGGGSSQGNDGSVRIVIAANTPKPSVQNPGVFFPDGSFAISSKLPSLGQSKTMIAVYRCSNSSCSMNIGLGPAINQTPPIFGICQTGGNTLYSPYLSYPGNLTFTPTNYTDINYAFASYDASQYTLTGMSVFNNLSLKAVTINGTNTDSGIVIGTTTGPYTSSNFTLYELIATSNAMSTSDRQEVEGYLASKWGLTLPSSHPYYNFPASGEQWVTASLPYNISGLASWLDMTLPGQTLNNIVDIASSTRPILYTINSQNLELSTIRGYTALTIKPFSPLLIPVLKEIPPTPSGSILFVYTQNGQTVAGQAIVGWGSGKTTPYGPILTYADSSGKLFAKNGGTNESFTGTSYNVSSGVPTLVFFGWDTSNFYISVNGNQQIVTTYAETGKSDYFSIGYGGNGTIPNMTIGELLVYTQYLEQSERQILEGYLSWKWGIVNNLSQSHPFKTEAPIDGTQKEQFPLDIPSQFESLTTWLDGGDSSTILLNNANVISWSDKSSSVDTFVTTATTNVIYSNTEEINGTKLPGVLFSLSGNMVGNVNAPFNKMRSGSCFLVGTVGVGGVQVMTGALAGESIGVDDGNSFGFYTLGNAYAPYQGFNNSNQNRFLFSANSTFVLFARFDGSGNGDGSVNFSKPTNVGNNSELWIPKIPSESPWTLGYTEKMRSSSQSFFLHEFICLSEYVTDTKRQVLEGYLAWKWGLQSNLPPDHPYKTGRPQSM